MKMTSPPHRFGYQTPTQCQTTTDKQGSTGNESILPFRFKACFNHL